MHFVFCSLSFMWHSCQFSLIALYFRCSKLKCHMSDWQQGKFNALLSHVSAPGKLPYKTLIGKLKKSLKRITVPCSFCMCVCLLKNTVDRMKYEALYEEENYSSGKQTNFPFSCQEEICLWRFEVRWFQIVSDDTMITLTSCNTFLCRKDSSSHIQIILWTSRDGIGTLALFSVIIQT